MTPSTNTSDWIVFRADSGDLMGSGHVVRCMTLADAFSRSGYRVVFVCAANLRPLTELIGRRGYELVFINPHQTAPVKNSYAHSPWLKWGELYDAEATVEAIRQAASPGLPAYIVVDHYALAAPWEEQLSSIAPVLAIDDLNDRPHQVRALLDQTFGKPESAYGPWVPPDTLLMLGASYALLRPEFGQLRQCSLTRRLQKPSVSNILVTMGGVDKDNVTERVLWALEPFSSDVTVNVVTGFANSHKDHLRELALSRWPGVRILEQVDDMASLMKTADLCIGAAGSTSWERCALGLPTVTLTLAENQRSIASNLAEVGATEDFGHLTSERIEELSHLVNDLLTQPERLFRMSENAAGVCDGRGVERVIKRLGLDV